MKILSNKNILIIASIIIISVVYMMMNPCGCYENMTGSNKCGGKGYENKSVSVEFYKDDIYKYDLFINRYLNNRTIAEFKRSYEVNNVSFDPQLCAVEDNTCFSKCIKEGSKIYSS